VERFTDPLRGGTLKPYTPDMLADPVEDENLIREQVSEAFLLRQGRRPTMAELGQLTRSAIDRSPVRGVEKFGRPLLPGTPVIAADDVARYCATLPAGTGVSDVVATTGRAGHAAHPRPLRVRQRQSRAVCLPALLRYLYCHRRLRHGEIKGSSHRASQLSATPRDTCHRAGIRVFFFAAVFCLT
jgi:hypothetical protein